MNLQKQFIYNALAFVFCVLLAFFVRPVNAEPADQQAKDLRVFLKTDKDIYAPGENIQFVARLLDCDNQKSTQSNQLIVMIKGSNGDIITDRQFPIINGFVSSEIIIPSWTQAGAVSVVAFIAQHMYQNQPSLAAIKPAFIHALRKTDFLVELLPVDQVVKPGEELELKLLMTHLVPSNRKEKVQLVLHDFKSEKFNTRLNLHPGINKVKIKIPSEVVQGLWVQVEANGKHFCYLKEPIRTTADEVKVAFFPEGGALLSNSVQRIVYRATNAFGEPVSLNGKVYDQGGHHVGLGKMLKPGLGLISLMPMPGIEYTFQPDGKVASDQKYILPQTHLNGIALNYLKTENNLIRFQIRVVGDYLNKELYLKALHGGRELFCNRLSIAAELRVDVETNVVPEGVVTFAIADSLDNILSQRLVYVGKPLLEGETVMPPIKISETGEEIVVEAFLEIVRQKWPDARLDIRVADRHMMFYQSDDFIKTSLKYKLGKTFPETVLDLYMTNIELIANYQVPSCFDLLYGIKEKPRKEISGQVLNKRGKPVAGAKVVAVTQNQSQVFNAVADQHGVFLLEGVDKHSDVRVKAYDDRGKAVYQVKLHHSFQESLDELISLASFGVKKLHDIGSLGDYYAQNRDVIRSYQHEIKGQQAGQNSNVERMLQSGSSILDVIKMMKGYDIVNNQIVFMGGHNSFNFQSGALIVIDGQKMGTDISVFSTLSSFDVLSIAVSTDPSDIQKYTGLNSVGIIEISTRGGAVSSKQMPNVREMGNPDVGNNKAEPVQNTRLWLTDLAYPVGDKLEFSFRKNGYRTDYVIDIDIVRENGETIRSSTVYESK